KLQALRKLKPQYLKPVFSLLVGLTDPTVNLSMGQTAENLAHQFNITRAQMDEYSSRSHALTRRSQERHLFDGQIIPLTDHNGQLYELDNGVRSDSTPGNLAKLKAVFDKPW